MIREEAISSLSSETKIPLGKAWSHDIKFTPQLGDFFLLLFEQSIVGLLFLEIFIKNKYGSDLMYI